MRSRSKTSRRMIEITALIVAMTIALPTAVAELRLPKVFSDHMVLQRELPVAVWGWGDAGKTITVKFGATSTTCVADAKGRWRTTLPAMKACAKPQTLTVGDGVTTKSFNDVLVGEVWLASGQSNMTVPLKEVMNAKDEIAAANRPTVRSFHLNYDMKHLANRPKDDFEGDGYGWTICHPDVAQNWSAVAYFFGVNLQKSLDVPIGIIHSSWGATGILTWCPREVVMGDPRGRGELAGWDAKWQAFRSGQTTTCPTTANNGGEFVTVSNQPAGLYNGTIAAIAPYSIRGVIWYQGESNTGLARGYRKLFSSMIQGWRKAWDRTDMPFLFVQLANFGGRELQPSESDWAEMREAQAMTQKLANTAMITAVDIGDETNIHPPNKQEVGRRLSLAALAKVYGKNVAWQGPVFSSMKIDGRLAELTFDHAEGLAAKDGALRGFAAAGDDHKFVWAKATIVGNRIVVEADGVSKIAAVRYDWAKNPDGNLVNGAGLPAFPFRTDTWPGVTGE